MEALNNLSMNSQSTKSEKCDFHFSHKINDLLSMILAAHHYTAGTPELIGGSLFKKVKLSILAREFVYFGINLTLK